MPMNILPQILLLWLSVYWQTLTSYFSDLLYADLLERCHNHLLVKLARSLDLSKVEAACAAFHHQEGPGRPITYPVSQLVRALLVGWLYQLSLRQLEQHLYSDLLVRWFVGIPLFAAAPDHSTLERFEQWVAKHQADIFFNAVIEQINDYFPKERQRPQIGDTYAMKANAADEDLVRRLRHVSQRLLEALVQALPEAAARSWQGFEWVQLFGVYPEKLGCFLDAEQRARRLSETVLAADELHRRVERLMSNYSSREYAPVRQWLGYLGKVLRDDVRITQNEAGQSVVSELSRRQKGSFRLISATDPEATLRVHGEKEEDISLGYNVQVAISTSGFIHETCARTGSDPDQSGVVDLIAGQVERRGDCPAKLIYDKAGGCGKVRSQVAEASRGQCMVSAKLTDFEQRSKRFGPYDFSLSQDGRSLTCPAGKTSTIAYRSGSGDGVFFRFYAFQCWNGDPPSRKKASKQEACIRRCSLWEQCRDARQGNQTIRNVFISDYRQYILDAKTYNQSEAFKIDMHLRPRVERVIFELTHYNGARHCRRRGLANANFQARMCAVSYNLKLWIRRTPTS